MKRTGPVPKRKGDAPETLSQAINWTTVKTRYRRAGLCEGCAGQAAYGHQLSFRRINPPCEADRGKILPERVLRQQGDRGQLWLNGHWHPRPED
jgi:hypothetical protein